MDDKIHTQSGLAGPRTCTPEPADDTEQMLAGDVMQCGVVSIERRESVQKAIALLIERDISGLPVTHQGRLEGILSEKDLLILLYAASYLPGLVEDYMTCDATTFDVETKLGVIRKHLTERPFRRVPILYQGRLAGMITRADLVRVYKERFRPLAARPTATDDDELLAEDAMKPGLLTVGPDTPLYDAMDMIVRHHITGLPVVDDGLNLLGIITEKDMLDCIDNPEAIGASVEAFMTRNVMAFDRKTSLNRICECLIEKDFHRIPILNGTRLVGIVSRSDILRFRTAVFKC
jgi:CBS domain-containing protein